MVFTCLITYYHVLSIKHSRVEYMIIVCWSYGFYVMNIWYIHVMIIWYSRDNHMAFTCWLCAIHVMIIWYSREIIWYSQLTTYGPFSTTNGKYDEQQQTSSLLRRPARQRREDKLTHTTLQLPGLPLDKHWETLSFNLKLHMLLFSAHAATLFPGPPSVANLSISQT